MHGQQQDSFDSIKMNMVNKWPLKRPNKRRNIQNRGGKECTQIQKKHKWEERQSQSHISRLVTVIIHESKCSEI